MKIKELAKEMFIPEKEHLKRLEMLGRKNTSKTIAQKKQLLKLIVQKFGNKELEKFNPREALKYLLSIGDIRSSSWKNHYLEVFRELYDEYLWKKGYGIFVPKFPRFTGKQKKADVFSTEELNRFFDEKIWKNKSMRLFFLLTATCGLRLGETRGLMVKQFNLKKHILIIDGFIRYDGMRTDFNKCGSSDNKKNRVVFLTKNLEKMLKTFFQNKTLNYDDLLFKRNGKPLRQEYCDRFFKKMLEAACIDETDRKLTPHSLRYTFVTRMRRYVNVDQVRILAGHSSHAMTDYYTKPTIEDMLVKIQGCREAAEKLFV